MSTAKKKSAKQRNAKKGGNFAEVVKKALENKRPGGGGPTQPKPRDSGKPNVRKNAF